MKRSPNPQWLGWNDGDHAAGPRKHITVSDPGLLTTLSCCIPGLILFPLLLTIILTAVFAQQVFYWLTAVLTMWTFLYSTNLSISCTIGAWRMRRDVEIDWHAKLTQLQEESPESSEVMHIVFMPNFKEDEGMMLHTLKNLARSAMARQRIYVVLAMEEREGEVAKEKAASLINSSNHLFADIFATFHPANVPGEVAGKSSNVQWAYTQVLQRLAPQLGNHDPTKVFLTCFDADTLFHPQYFSALTYEGMTMPSHERAWSLWQPPILLMRNIFSCPAPTRLSGYATILFELAGLANQKFVPAFSYSAYSTTLALVSHRFVDGWDRDVIAEDHHMWCKCYFASIWDQLQAVGAEPGCPTQPCRTYSLAGDVKPALKLHPVYLPAISYLVESDGGWFASVHARFMQARRHAQGLAEISYVILQHMYLLMSEHGNHLAVSTHMRTLGIAGKMANVHMIPHIHSLSFFMTVICLVPGIVQWLLSQGPSELLQAMLTRGLQGVLSLQSFGGVTWALCTIFGPIPPLGIMMSLVTFTVVKDTLEGKYTGDVAAPKKVGPTDLVAPDVQGSIRGPGGMRWREQLRLLLVVQTDYFGGALITMVAYGLIPATLASWSLLRTKGNGFKYVVGEKPKNSA